ncbi:MAG: hypothetical protein HQ528_04980 [Candidatus Marinimicrobia bacterium]|nr:hypothetical protein [Candidatus Neomarinimicrobiota bacterium]
MNIESRLTELIDSNHPVTDSDDFIERLHTRRRKAALQRQQRKSGLMALALVGLVTIFSQLQINSTTNRLAFLEENYFSNEDFAVNEQFIDEAALFLINQSDDIWATLEFFDDVEYNLIQFDKELQK